MTKIRTFPKEIHKNLKNYVYMLRDPRNGEVFYVGKGKENRCFDHLNQVDSYQKKSQEEKEKLNKSDKIDRILDIRNNNETTQIDILIHGLDNGEKTDKKDRESLLVESAVIDALGGVQGLTNLQSGHGSRDSGIMTVENIIAKYETQKNVVEFSKEHSGILIKINKLFIYNMKPSELYDITRTAWVISKDKTTSGDLKYAYAVYNNIIQEVYEVQAWFKAGTTLNARNADTNTEEENVDRWEFVGQIADEKIRAKYKHKRLKNDLFNKKGQSNPIMYVGIDSQKN